uniref:Secreted protein n=1 Tax=Alexandrium andersonii TaxID=327968 RepID=A0A7S2DJ08_9DINO
MAAVPPQKVVVLAQVLFLQLLDEFCNLVSGQLARRQVDRLPEVVVRVGPRVVSCDAGRRLAIGAAVGPLDIVNLHSSMEDTAQLDRHLPVCQERVQPPDTCFLGNVINMKTHWYPKSACQHFNLRWV